MTFSSFLTTLMLLGVLLTAEAFQIEPSQRTTTKLAAWTLPTPNLSPFGGTWYNEYNPTARRTVYEDSPLDYTFVTLGDDWPSAYEPDSENATSVVEHKRLRNPFRLAKEWALRRRRRS